MAAMRTADLLAFSASTLENEASELTADIDAASSDVTPAADSETSAATSESLTGGPVVASQTAAPDSASSQQETPRSAAIERRPRRQTAVRRLIEQDLGIDSVMEALEFAVLTDRKADGSLDADSTELAAALVPRADSKPPGPLEVMLQRLADPVFASSSITQVMKDSGVSLPELLTAVRKRDVALALAASSKHIAPLLNDLGDDARSRTVTCNYCGGNGQVQARVASEDEDGEPIEGELQVCPKCYGDGTLRIVGNSDARKLFLAVHGIGGAGKGGPGMGGASTVVNVQQGVKVDATKDSRQPITSVVQSILEGEEV